jgi:acyl-CoA thioester hydrolase
MAGIVHFSNFFRYMESAEHAFFRSLGHSVTLADIDEALGLPRVHANCDYKHPLRFEDEVEIHMLVESVKHKSLTYQFRFYRLQNEARAEEVAQGRITVVCVRKNADGRMGASALPGVIRNQIQSAPAEMLMD